MCSERFDHLLGLVKNSITKENINFRKAVSAKGSQRVNSQASSGEIRLFEWHLIFDDVAGMSFIPNARG